jgi:hypothetical protein
MSSSAGSEKKTMFEIYKEAAGGEYKVVYFTELDDHTREMEISSALKGQHVFDGFILNQEKLRAKRAVRNIIDRLNQGESILPNEIERELKQFMA